MILSESDRADLYTGLSEALGSSHRAELLMGALPLYDLDEVATKGDIAEMRADFAEQRAATRTDITEMRADFAELRAATRTDIAGVEARVVELRAELKTDIAELRAEIAEQGKALQQTVAGWMIALLIAIVGAIVAFVVTAARMV